MGEPRPDPEPSVREGHLDAQHLGGEVPVAERAYPDGPAARGVDRDERPLDVRLEQHGLRDRAGQAAGRGP